MQTLCFSTELSEWIRIPAQKTDALNVLGSYKVAARSY